MGATSLVEINVYNITVLRCSVNVTRDDPAKEVLAGYHIGALKSSKKSGKKVSIPAWGGD